MGGTQAERGPARRLPLWAYGAIAGGLSAVFLLSAGRVDMLSTVELAIPAVFWTLTFAVIAWRRTLHR